jgi:hypothetical protein
MKHRAAGIAVFAAVGIVVEIGLHRRSARRA